MAPKNEWAEKDYYAVLGVDKKATEAEIKKAYRKIARDNHPDSHPGDSAAEERFKAAAEAYDVLGDETKRKEYDEFRSMVSMGGFRGFGQNGGAGFPGGFQQNDFDLSDLFGRARTDGGFTAEGGFGDIFGSVFNRSAPRNTRPKRGADVETEITLEFREAVQGTTIPIQLTGEVPCSSCHGSGSKSGKTATCSTCQGTGFTSEQRGAFGFSAPCKDCEGKGNTISDPCPDCRGTGTVRRTRSITVRIPVGVIDGQKVRLAGQGEAGPHGTPAGDLFVHVRVKPDAVFSRNGDDLEVTVPVSFPELILGDTISVPTLESSVRLKIPAGTPNGRVLRVRGRGVPKRSGAAGDLLVKVEAKVPEHIDTNATTALRAYAQAEKASGFNPREHWAGNK